MWCWVNSQVCLLFQGSAVVVEKLYVHYFRTGVSNLRLSSYWRTAGWRPPTQKTSWMEVNSSILLSIQEYFCITVCVCQRLECCHDPEINSLSHLVWIIDTPNSPTSPAVSPGGGGGMVAVISVYVIMCCTFLLLPSIQAPEGFYLQMANKQKLTR